MYKLNATFFIVNKQINKRLARKQKRRLPYELISGHWTRCLHKLCEYNEYKMRTFDKVGIFAENNDDYFKFLYQ